MAKITVEHTEISTQDKIENKILTIRGQQVMIDRDLAELYEVETRRLNEQVKRNIERFPEEFMFQLTEEELKFLISQVVTSTGQESSKSQNVTLNEDKNLMSQIATSSEIDFSRSQIATLNKNGNRRGTNIKYLPYAFTEQGVAMLSSVLKSETAVKMSIQIMKAFVAMRHFLLANEKVFVEIDSIKKHLIDSDIHQKETDRRVDELFDKMDRYAIEDKQGIFFQGQIFDAYAKFESFIQSAKKEIILIDGYIDLTVLERLSKKKKGVNVILYTDAKTKITNLDVQKFNAQYPTLTMNFTSKMHDRFLIIDGKILYHIGASLKDLGKKCFGFEILDASFIPVVLAAV